MGAPFIDYIIADEFIVPRDREMLFAEKLAYLPDCYQPNDTRRDIAAAPRRAACGLPEQAFVFCAFNNSFKITPAFFAIWMRLLQQLPGSVLWLLESNPLVRRNLDAAAAAAGADPARLVSAPILPHPDHLARHRHADLFLDTLPCNAHTTASDALWAGLPVLTCCGDTFAGRVAGSLLVAMGMPELITESLEEYEHTALVFAGHPQRLIPLPQKREEKRDISSLFDLPKLTGNIEAAYTRIWQTWLSGQTPAAFSIESA